ncbi:MAG: DUF116 domain-containing protein [Methanosarcina sp.]
MEIPYEYLGKVFIALILLAFTGTGVALLIGAYSFKKHKIIFPGFVLFTLYLFYSPAKWICKILGIRDTLVDDILIDVRNAVMCNSFVHTKGLKILLLPQCLRHPNCKARCDPVHGYECKRCGLCDISKLCEAADQYNFKVFVVPGGSFVKKIFKENRPEACLGVACYNELSENMQAVSFVPVQGVLLLKDGCFNTQANIEEIIQKMEMCNV